MMEYLSFWGDEVKLVIDAGGENYFFMCSICMTVMAIDGHKDPYWDTLRSGCPSISTPCALYAIDENDEEGSLGATSTGQPTPLEL
jgi:hypothetical protein